MREPDSSATWSLSSVQRFQQRMRSAASTMSAIPPRMCVMAMKNMKVCTYAQQHCPGGVSIISQRLQRLEHRLGSTQTRRPPGNY